MRLSVRPGIPFRWSFAATIGSTAAAPATAGKHTLTVNPLDPGLVFDMIVIDLGGLKPAHLGPLETRSTR